MYLGRYLLTYMPLISQLIIYFIYIVSGEYTYDILGYVFKISINQELHYSDTDLGNQFGYQLPNVKIFASNPLHDAFVAEMKQYGGLMAELHAYVAVPIPWLKLQCRPPH